MVTYHAEADLVAAVHAAYIAFVVFGFIAIILGVAMGWQWVRNVYFRAAHLAAILLVCVEAMIGVSCPLTILEDRLRVLGADTPYPGSFVGLRARSADLLRLPAVAFHVGLSVFRRAGAIDLPVGAATDWSVSEAPVTLGLLRLSLSGIV